MMTIINKLSAFIMAAICAVVPLVNYEAENPEEILLNAAIISDVHIDTTLPLGKLMLAKGFEDMTKNKTENDAVIVAGDLTNYGDRASLEDFYNILGEADPAGKWIIAAGNHDIGHAEDYSNNQARKWLINRYNKYTKSKTENIYYSKVVNGYTFIVLCDESKDNWDSCDISKKQAEFLDKQLKKATKGGKPAFVICHWPIEGVNGQKAVYDSAIEGVYAKRVRNVLEKYNNVFYISGHMHKGVNGEIFEDVFGFSSVETSGGVTYVSIPAYSTPNRYGLPWNGLGMQMEVYENEVVFRPRRYVSSTWYNLLEYRVPITK